MRTLMSSAQGKTRKALWDITKSGEEVSDSADLLPRIPSRDDILLDETLEMRLNGVLSVIILKLSISRSITIFRASRVGKAGELCAQTQGCISP